MTERNTDSLDVRSARRAEEAAREKRANQAGREGVADAGAAVQAQLEANERARQILESQQKETEVVGGGERREVADKADATDDAMQQDGKASADENEKTKKKIDKEPIMAVVNLAPRQNGMARNFTQNRKVWLGVGGALLAVVLLVIVGVVIGVNNEGNNCGDGGSVVLDYEPEGYGDDVSSQVVVAVFNEDVTNRLNADENYTYEDAIADYENAYNMSEDEVRFGILLSHAYFVFTETGDADAAVSVLGGIADSLTDESDIMQYYTMIINIYNRAGLPGQANYYRSILDGLIEPQTGAVEDCYSINGGMNE